MNDHPSRLRYVDADQLDTRVLDLDGLDVRNQHDDHIGDVEGILIDSISGRPRYLVVDSGGWFRSRKFLLPVAHARLDGDRRALRVDFDKDTINRFPEMRTDRYDAITDAELQRYDAGVWRASGLAEIRRADVRGPEDDVSPTWWNSTAWASTPVAEGPRVGPGRPFVAGEEVMARSEDHVRARAERERVMAQDRDRAPAVGERAQPGDILGIESAGETTSLGDTAEDEDRRRERAAKHLRDVVIEEDRDRNERRR